MATTDNVASEGAARLMYLLFHNDVAGLPDLLTQYANAATNRNVDLTKDIAPREWFAEQELGAIAMLGEAMRRLAAHDDSDVDSGEAPDWLLATEQSPR